MQKHSDFQRLSSVSSGKNDRALDLSQVPFWQFVFFYILLTAAWMIGAFILVRKMNWHQSYLTGIYAGSLIQGGFSVFKVFLMNREWPNPPMAQMFFMLLSFIISLIVLSYFSIFTGDNAFLVGFFIAYYLNVKIIVLIAYFYSGKEKDE
ncbi:MAG TPA: hypothetical protein PKK94_09190 [Leptospiraceae bacterium]|nr:hypothetical protein [Leptospiraceae bacterium]